MSSPSASAGSTGARPARSAAPTLEPLLRSPVMDAFAAALNDTTYPGQRMESWLGLLRPLVSANDRVCYARTLGIVQLVIIKASCTLFQVHTSFHAAMPLLQQHMLSVS